MIKTIKNIGIALINIKIKKLIRKFAFCFFKKKKKMNEKLGKRGILFSNAFHFDRIISTTKNIIIPSIIEIHHNAFFDLINILKDENVTYLYKFDEFKQHYFFDIAIRDIYVDDRYMFRFSFDYQFCIFNMRVFKNAMIQDFFCFG